MKNHRVFGPVFRGVSRFGGWAALPALLVLLLLLLLSALLIFPGAGGSTARPHITGTPAEAEALSSYEPAGAPPISGLNIAGAIARSTIGTTGAARGSLGQTDQSNPGTPGTSDKASSELKWLDGSLQTNYDNDCFDGAFIPITSQFVGYWGSTDATSPRVGEVFYGRVAVGGVGNACSGPYAELEVIPPAGVFLAIDSHNKVRCSVGTIRDPEFTELPDSKCPQSTWKGAFGYVLNQPSGLPWDVSGGKMIIVAFPLIATKVLSGTGSGSTLTVGVHTFDGWLSPWGAPTRNLAVADNPPSIRYDAEVTPSGNGTKTSATVFNHFKAGEAYFDIGTTAGYGVTSEPIHIRANADAYRVYEIWQELEPGVKYHWRVRFVADGGKTYAGADQTFIAGKAQPTPRPRPSATPSPQRTPGAPATPTPPPGATATPRT